MQKISWVFALALLSGCSSDGGGDADGSSGGTNGGGTMIAATPLSGKINGQPWSFVSGQTDPFLSDGEPNFWAALYAESFPCLQWDSEH